MLHDLIVTNFKIVFDEPKLSTEPTRFCGDCYHFAKNRSGTGVCYKNPRVDLVTGNKTYRSPYIERAFTVEDGCNPEGRWYEENLYDDE